MYSLRREGSISDFSLENKLLTAPMIKPTINILIKKRTFSLWRDTAWMPMVPGVVETLSFTCLDPSHIETTTAQHAEALRHRTHQSHWGSMPSARGVALSCWL